MLQNPEIYGNANPPKNLTHRFQSVSASNLQIFIQIDTDSVARSDKWLFTESSDRPGRVAGRPQILFSSLELSCYVPLPVYEITNGY